MAIRLQPAPGVHGKTRRPSRHQDRTRGATDLIENQRGAIMVIGIFIAMMLVGMLYYVWGIGGAVLFRERMNDAADASAFSAGVVHARGMNLLVLINIIMAALAAVEAGLHTAADGIEYAAWAALGTCLGCGPWCGYCCRACPYVGPYFSASSTADNVHDAAVNIIDPLMDAAHLVAVAVREGSPIAAQALVVSYSQSAPYAPTTEIGVMFPLLPNLQAEDDPTNWPCDEKVYWPALAVAGVASLIEISFNVSEWYAAGMGLAWLIDHEDNSRNYCPDYFQRVTEGSELGEDEFQIRTLMYGRSPHEWTRGGVALADWGRTDGSGGVMDALEPLTYVSFAQSEYFYEQPFDDDAHDREEWMWHQRWRARLRRFRLPSGGGDGGASEACSVAGDACGSLFDLSSIVVH